MDSQGKVIRQGINLFIDLRGQESGDYGKSIEELPVISVDKINSERGVMGRMKERREKKKK